MNLQNRIELLLELSKYFKENGEEWQAVKAKAAIHNGWFIPQFIDLALENIQSAFLEKEKLEHWAAHYHLDDNIGGKNIGLVMAGNIPLGAPVFGFQSVTYKRVKVGTEWYVGLDSAGTVQPIIGPLADSLGFKLSYYNSANAKLAWPYNTVALRKTVVRISIALALKTAMPVRKNTGTPAADTSRVTLDVALRNNRRF